MKQLKEKQERERKRKEAIQEAIELAQKEAQLAKNRNRVNNVNLKKSRNEPLDCIQKNDIEQISDILLKEDKDQSIPEPLNNTRKTPIRIELPTQDITNNLEIAGKSEQGSRSRNNSLQETSQDLSSLSELNTASLTYSNIMPISISTPRTENVTLFLQPQNDSISNMQYAVLVPVVPHSIPVVPSNVPQSARSCSTSRTENRILTPTIYRNKNVMLCDSCTQTDESIFNKQTPEMKDRFIREKLTNLELSYENKSRKERRSRSESIGERPKWGANRPPTRYLKQSEKDLLYQRRKVRQKARPTNGYGYRNSSDDSQPGSPISYKRKSYSEKRTTRAQWHKQDQFFNQSIRMYQSEVVPLEADKGRIYYRNDCCCTCKCKHRCSEDNIKVDLLRIEHVSPREKSGREKSEKLPDMRETDSTFNDLSEYNDGLLDDKPWDQSPSTPSLSSAK